ncbi:MAG: TetR/AcrR family transcriptional regulator [Chloroflexi bacterium]|nr:MAG: TetR/AcrR family transcriptional regulator [Chloroflexota bacterium]
MSVQTRILEAAAELLAKSVDADVSTRSICEAARVTAPTLYHYFADKESLLRAVVDFGWAQFLETKRVVAAVVHEHVADDIRAGWDNHVEFAQKNPNFYRLMWSPGIAQNSAALREAHQMLYDRLKLGASRGQLKVSPALASRTVMSATVGAALMLISQPERYSDASFAKQLREAVIASVTVSDAAAGKGRSRRGAAREATIASVAATLSGKLESDPNPLTAAERQLMQQWLTTLADSETA